jgi:hypothetical protein
MSDVNISKFRAQVIRTGSTPASPGFVVSEGQNPVDPSGSGQNHLPVTIATASTGLSITESQILSGAGLVSQYIRGDGSLADFPATTGGGSSVSYYLNGSVSQGTIGGVAYKELNRTPVFGAGTDISISADGYIASFITDALDPNKLLIPAGNWNFETYFSASSSGGTPSFYIELYKYNGTTFTLLATSSAAPELIAFGTSLNPYYSTLAVPETVLALTDRLALRYYVTHSGRTITLHTENGHLCEVITTFTTGLTALNGLTNQVQFFAVGTSGTDFAISSVTDTHTFNLPTASATNRGALSSADWTTFNNKENAITAGTTAQYFRGDKTFQTLNTSVVPELTNLYYTEARVNANTNVAANTAARHNAVTLGTANGLSLSTQVLSLGLASAGVTGALSGTDWSTFNNKQNALTLTTTGTSGAATLVGSTLNIPQYQAAGTYVTAVTASSPLASSGGTTPNITIQQASGSQNGFLSSTDWTTFNNKQNALTNPVTGTGTTNYLPKFTGASTIGNSLVYDNGSGVTINGTTVGEKFNINGYIGLQRSNTQYWHVGVDSNNSISFTRSGIAERMVLSSDGNLGLGVTPSAWGVGQRAFDFGTIGSIETDGDAVAMSNNRYFDGGANRYKINDFASIFVQVNGQHIWYNAPSGTAGNAISFTQAMTLTSGGNLLVGTTTDAGFKLDVNGTGRFSGADGADLIRFNATGVNTNYAAKIVGAANDVLVFRRQHSSVGALDIMALGFNGNVGIGTTSPSSPLHVVNSSNGFIYRFAGGTSSAITGGIFAEIGRNFASIGTTSNHGFNIFTNDFDRLAITSSGNVGIGTSSPSNGLLVINSTASNGVRFALESSGTMNGIVALGSNAISGLSTTDMALWTRGVMAFETGASGEKMRITSGGNVLIATTTDNGAKLNVNGTIRTANPTGSTSDGWLLGRALVSGSSTPDRWIRVQIGNLYYDILSRYIGSV